MPTRGRQNDIYSYLIQMDGVENCNLGRGNLVWKIFVNPLAPPIETHLWPKGRFNTNNTLTRLGLDSVTNKIVFKLVHLVCDQLIF